MLDLFDLVVVFVLMMTIKVTVRMLPAKQVHVSVTALEL
jgi:hypothetical protein